MNFDIAQYRADFPILSRQVYGKPLVYLDNGATTQKPRAVVDAMVEEYYNANANVHRGVHFLSQQATDLHEQSRRRVAQFIGAASEREIVFTRGTTESLNLVAQCFAQACMKEGDEVLLSTMEHHSNIVPWQLAAQRTGIKIRIVPMEEDGTISLQKFAHMFTARTKVVSICQVSNVLGTINPIAQMAAIAHAHGAAVVVDGAQSVPHMAVNVRQMNCDFFAFSGHKMYGPTGIGVLYGKEEWLEKLPPYMGGGEMIKRVSFEQTTYNELPYKFEAGTPDYIASTGLAKAIDYLCAIGMHNIEAHEKALAKRTVELLGQIDGLQIYGPLAHGQESAGPVSFNIAGIHHLDLGTLLDRLGIAVRTGHHCAEPLMTALGIEGTVRASFGLYNTLAEVETLAEGIARVSKMFR